MDLLQETENRVLRYDFSAVEVHEHSLQLAAKTKELQAVDEECKTVASQYAARKKEIKATCNKLSNLVADGYEMRNIECEVQYHKPQQGKKTIIRKDTGVIVAEEAMTDYEWNLFNQPQDDEAEPAPEPPTEEKPKKKRGRKKKETDSVDDENEDLIF